MHKLIILFEQDPLATAFQPGWQRFLSMVEKMPGLRGQFVSNVERLVFGKPENAYVRIHELLFDTREALETALRSPEGQDAGRFLQMFTHGKVILLTAVHLEDQKATPRKPRRSTKSNTHTSE